MKPGPPSIGRLWRTVRCLKAEQIWGRLRFRLQRPRPDLRAAPPLRPPAGAWLAPPARQASLIGPAHFRFLAEDHALESGGWDDPAVPLLWRYNLHYFDDLNACAAASRSHWHRALVQRWCEENPPANGTAWAPYPTSLRIVNWVKWFLAGQAPEPAWLHSLAVQARWLTRRLEWHLLGNHLFANAKALVFVGLYFEGAEADSWLATGLRILQRELPEQILSDGGQFERSPMYHALALEDLLDLLNIAAARGAAGAPPAQQLLQMQVSARAPAMLHWLRCLRHPSGALVRFNDSAEGIAPSTDDLERYASQLGIVAATPPQHDLTTLQPSGYVRAANGAAVAFLDVAPIGPDYLPGHAHADTLSFELSVADREIVVNRGTSVYGTGSRRQWERGTAAHSTVQIGGQDSSEVWAGFRVGRRARPGTLHIAGGSVECSHNGYAHLANSPIHHRRWQLEAGALTVEDRLAPTPQETAVAHIHLAPGLVWLRNSANCWSAVESIVEGQVERTIEHVHIEIITGVASAITTLHAQRFGLLIEASTMVVGLTSGRAAVRFTWGA